MARNPHQTMTEEQQGTPAEAPEEDRPFPLEHPNLATALLHAQVDAPNVAALRQHYDGYPYASYSDCKDTLLPILRRHGLVFTFAGTAEEVSQEVELGTSRGGVQWMTDVAAHWVLLHVHSGEQMKVTTLGRRTNDKDKGIQHAISSSGKKALLELLGVDTVKDEEGPDEAPQVTSEARGYRGRRERGSKSARRKPRRTAAPPGAPPPKDTGKPPKEAEATPEERISFCQARVREYMNRHRFKSYHLEALAEVDKKLREKIEVWNAEEWEHCHEIAKSRPQRFDQAVAVMGEKEPTDQERLDHLSRLLDGPGGAKLDQPDGIVLRSAADAKWHDAVEWWISKLERLAGGVE